MEEGGFRLFQVAETEVDRGLERKEGVAGWEC